MLIVCPACASEYEIDAERVGATGRSVRCAACRETWFITPDAVAASETPPDFDVLGRNPFTASGGEAAGLAEAASAEPATVIDQPIPSRARPVKTARPGTFAIARFPAISPALAAGLVVSAMLPLTLLGRNAVVRAVPQTAGFFAAIGLPVNLRGMTFAEVVAFQTPPENGKPAELVVEGDLVGVSPRRVEVAQIAIEVRDDRGATLKSWTIAPPRPALESGETARFRASVPAPPERGRAVQVRFADAADAHHAGAKPAEAEPRREAVHARSREAAAHDAPAAEPGHPDAH